MTELIDHGYDGVTMLNVAKRAGASKETLYSWFGSRDGLFETLIKANGANAAAGVQRALSQGGSPREVLTGFAIGLVTLLTGRESVALNRAAMTSSELAQVLLAGGRYTVGPLVEDYLAQLHATGALHAPDAATSFRLLYGLVIEDIQIRVLLGEAAPSAKAIRLHAAAAVDRFMVLSQG